MHYSLVMMVSAYIVIDVWCERDVIFNTWSHTMAEIMTMAC